MTPHSSLLIVEPDPDRQNRIRNLVAGKDIPIQVFSSTSDLEVRLDTGLAVLVADEDRALDTFLASEAYRSNPRPLIAYAIAADPQRVVQTVLLGVDEFLEWPFTLTKLKKAIRLAQGRNALRRFPRDSADALLRIATLSEREREVLARVAAGKSGREIGEELHISLRTAEVHRLNINKKLGVRNAIEAARIAFEAGLIR